MSLTKEDSSKKKKLSKASWDKKRWCWKSLVSNTQQWENHEFDNSGPDLARRGQVPDELGVGKVSSAFKLCGQFWTRVAAGKLSAEPLSVFVGAERSEAACWPRGAEGWAFASVSSDVFVCVCLFILAFFSPPVWLWIRTVGCVFMEQTKGRSLKGSSWFFVFFIGGLWLKLGQKNLLLCLLLHFHPFSCLFYLDFNILNCLCP